MLKPHNNFVVILILQKWGKVRSSEVKQLAWDYKTNMSEWQSQHLSLDESETRLQHSWRLNHSAKTCFFVLLCFVFVAATSTSIKEEASWAGGPHWGLRPNLRSNWEQPESRGLAWPSEHTDCFKNKAVQWSWADWWAGLGVDEIPEHHQGGLASPEALERCAKGSIPIANLTPESPLSYQPGQQVFPLGHRKLSPAWQANEEEEILRKSSDITVLPENSYISFVIQKIFIEHLLCAKYSDGRDTQLLWFHQAFIQDGEGDKK